MSEESPFVGIAHSVAHRILLPHLRIVRGAPLLYEITVNNQLEVMSQEQVRKPKRGVSSFQTDLCIFEDKTAEI